MPVHSVSEITKYIKQLINSDSILKKVMVCGEISNFKQYASGHCYFTLKDADASLKCVMFHSRAQRLRFVPTNGLKVITSGTVSVYERDGLYQFYVDTLVPEGAGELSLAFEQLKEKLTDEGLFLETYKKDIPSFPKTIGVITSLSGAVLRDIYHVAKRRNPAVRLVLYPVQVQGAESAAQIAKGIEIFNKSYSVDVLIVGRGGGSMEDLWSFNEEIVVRAIFASKIPIISAVGHETDYTLADFVSDVRAATPSQAAELAVPDTADLSRYVLSLKAQLDRVMRNGLQQRQGRLEMYLKRVSMCSPQRLLSEKRQWLDSLQSRLVQRTEVVLTNKKQRMQIAFEKLALLNPAEVLRRGYGIVKRSGNTLHSIEAVEHDQVLEIVLADGSFTAIVSDVRRDDA
ncbi:MAG: exodeoxyribonuclease VII large subunit [Selenomonadaceae bacterium]